MKTIWYEHPTSGQQFDVVKGTDADKYARQQGCKEIPAPKKGKGSTKTSEEEGGE